MAYILTHTDGSFLGNINDGQADGIDNTAPGNPSYPLTNLVLFGKNYAGYGLPMNDNFITLLENSASNTPPQYPLPGQLWWDKGNLSLNVNTATLSTQPPVWRTTSGSTSQATPPANPRTGQLWWDTTNQLLKVWSGTAWVVTGSGGGNANVSSQTATITVLDNIAAPHVVTTITVNGTVESVLSNDPTFLTSDPQIPGFSTVGPGINILPGTQYWGTLANGTTVFGSTPIVTDNSSLVATTAFVQEVANIIVAGGAGVSTFNTRAGNVVLLNIDISGALGYSPINAAPVGFTYSNGSGWSSSYSSTGSGSVVLSTGANISAANLTVTHTIVGNITGSATTATYSNNTYVNPTANNGTYYPTFSDVTLGYAGMQISPGFTVNPSTNTVTAGSFVGSLIGNANTATNLYGPVLLPSGTTAITYLIHDNSANIATTSYVDQSVQVATGVSSFNGQTGAVVLSYGNVTTALGYTPVNKAGDTISGSLMFSGNSLPTITGLPNPTNASDAANKNYVDLATTALNLHSPAVAATTGNLLVTIQNGTTDQNGGLGIGMYLTSTSNVTLVVDTYPPVVSDRILVKNQANATVNGVYTVSNIGSVSYPWILTRATDDDDHIYGQVSVGDYIFISNGSVNKATSWVQTGTGSGGNAYPRIGIDNIVYTQFGGAGTYSAGTGLQLTGTVFSVLLGAAIKELPSGEVGVDVYPTGGIMTTTDGTTSNTDATSQLSLTTVGSAGTYTSVTTDIYGRVTAGSYTTPSLANNLAGGSAGVMPYQTAANTTSFTAVGVVGNVLISGGTGSPTWTSSPTFSTFTTTSGVTIDGLIDISSFAGDKFKESNDPSPFREGSFPITASGTFYTLAGDYIMRYWTHNSALDSSGNFLGVDDNGSATVWAFTEGAIEKTWTSQTQFSGNIPGVAPYPWIQTRQFNTNTGAAFFAGNISTNNSFVGSGSGLTNIPNGALINSSITVGSTAISLGGTSTTLTGLTSVASTSFTGNVTGNLTGYATNVITNANLTGDVTSIGNATTLATVNANIGMFGDAGNIAQFTVNGKGLITSVSNVAVTIPSGVISVTGSDLTLSGTTGTAITNATLATVNATTGQFGDTTHVPQFTVNAKGLITAAGNVAINTMVYPGAGIANSTGSAWDASYNTSGTGDVALTTSPVFTTPSLGAATATSINNVSISTSSTGSTLTIADGKTFIVNNSISLLGTDSTTMTFPATSANVAATNIAQTFTKTQSAAVTNLSVVANVIAIDFSLSNNFAVTLQGNIAQTLGNASNVTAGTSGQIAVTQNAFPSTLAFGGNWIPVSGVSTVSSVAGAVSLITFYAVDSTHTWYGISTGNAAVVTTFNTRSGNVTLTSSDVSTALGYTPLGNLTGDVTSVGNATTLATVNANVGTFTTHTVNAKGLVTAAGNLIATGDATGTAIAGNIALTLATVNANVGTFGNSTYYNTITVNSKGLVTAVANVISPLQVYPGAGVPLSTGSAWGTSYNTTGTGNVVLNTGAGGSIQGVPIGNATPSSGAFTTLTASSTVTLSPASGGGVTISPTSGGGVTISPPAAFVSIHPGGQLSLGSGITGVMDNVNIGSTTPGTGKFTTLTLTGNTTTTGNIIISGNINYIYGNVVGNITGISSSTNALNSATTIVNVSAATAPTVGQVLTATSSTTATWQVSSGLSTDGYQNSWGGNLALSSVNGGGGGVSNTAIGYQVLKNLTTGSYNVGLGSSAGHAITTGSNNVVIGSSTGSTIATSDNNIIISDGAGTERLKYIDSTGNLTLTANTVTVSNLLTLSSYSKTSLPSATVVGQVIYVNDATRTGGTGSICFSQAGGTGNWVDLTTGNIVV